MQEDWLDAEETASSLQITKATLYKLIRDDYLPARKVSGRWWVSRTHIEQMFAGAAPALLSGGPVERQAGR